MPKPRHGRRRGRGRGFRGGRPRVQPAIDADYSKIGEQTTLHLTPAELEALRLSDEENLTQEDAAERMKISRGTFWRILDSARKKVTSSLMAGKEIRVILEDPSSNKIDDDSI
ncbi:MAG: DUF134 domain-containing protein [Candidatus Heimdallarchaeota archaeon]|nr:MAG: DUF134 domain-containing protein [Candidatus Heimdallarchaeota archaeon]